MHLRTRSITPTHRGAEYCYVAQKSVFALSVPWLVSGTTDNTAQLRSNPSPSLPPISPNIIHFWQFASLLGFCPTYSFGPGNVGDRGPQVLQLSRNPKVLDPTCHHELSPLPPTPLRTPRQRGGGAQRRQDYILRIAILCCMLLKFCSEGVCKSPFLRYVPIPLPSSLLHRGAGPLAQ